MAPAIRRVLVTLVAASVVTASGCGSGSARTSSEASGPTKKEYLRQAHAICYRLSKKQVRETKAFSRGHGFDPGEPDQGEREQLIAAVVVPVAEEKLEELAELAPPAGDKRKVTALLRGIEEGIHAAEVHPAWLAAPTPAHEQPFEHGMNLWADYGDWLCGQAGG